MCKLILRNIPTGESKEDVRNGISQMKSWPKIVGLYRDDQENWIVSFGTEDETTNVMKEIAQPGLRWDFGVTAKSGAAKSGVMATALNFAIGRNTRVHGKLAGLLPPPASLLHHSFTPSLSPYTLSFPSSAPFRFSPFSLTLLAHSSLNLLLSLPLCHPFR
jgi:hypothetical protein